VVHDEWETDGRCNNADRLMLGDWFV